jgi:hypothetical protein
MRRPGCSQTLPSSSPPQPASALNSEDLPVPLRPISATLSPASSWKSAWSSSGTWPKASEASERIRYGMGVVASVEVGNVDGCTRRERRPLLACGRRARFYRGWRSARGPMREHRSDGRGLPGKCRGECPGSAVSAALNWRNSGAAATIRARLLVAQWTVHTPPKRGIQVRFLSRGLSGSPAGSAAIQNPNVFR